MIKRPAEIAVVDDDASVLRALARLVQALGYSAVPCSSLEEIHRHMAQHRPDCILLDVHLPDGSALELLQQHQPEPRPPVIIITASDDPALRAACMAAGAAAYIVKPVRRSDIEPLLHALLVSDH